MSLSTVRCACEVLRRRVMECPEPRPSRSTKSPISTLDSLDALVSAALQLGAESVDGWSAEERALVKRTSLAPVAVDKLRDRIASGSDPLGDAYYRIRNGEERRGLGQTYTPPAIISSMLEWSAGEVAPARVVDPGSGSGRFTVAAGRRFPKAQLLAVDVDPIATLMTRGSVAGAGFAKRSTVLLRDYRELDHDHADGPTLFIGNPPYVRHHQIDQEWKRWLLQTAATRGHVASGLAGVHVHFFLATVEHGVPGDVGTFITSAEWLDVNYGSLVRQLLLDGLGGLGVHVLDPDAAPFTDVATTGVITTFRLGSHPKSIKLRRVKTVDDFGALEGGRPVSRERLAEAKRWTPLIRVTPKLPEGWIELGELCRVHRGAVTGANDIWVTKPDDLLGAQSRCSGAVHRQHEVGGLHGADHTEAESPGFSRGEDSMDESVRLIDARARHRYKRLVWHEWMRLSLEELAS
ncbi:MAG: Eco57I restriction-modification methylase domain-containing protein [Acidimicrobiales bacterium]